MGDQGEILGNLGKLFDFFPASFLFIRYHVSIWVLVHDLKILDREKRDEIYVSTSSNL